MDSISDVKRFNDFVKSRIGFYLQIDIFTQNEDLREKPKRYLCKFDLDNEKIVGTSKSRR